MRSLLSSLNRSQSGTAAAEMALVTPLLIAILFGAFELGNFFYSTHVVATAVRDGARYASRRSFSDYPSCAPIQDVIDKTRYVTRTGQVTSGGPTRIRGWTADTTVTVSVTCDTSGSYGGIYNGLAGGVRIVTVSAAVPYTSLFGTIGIATGNSLTLNARSQAPVMGI